MKSRKAMPPPSKNEMTSLNIPQKKVASSFERDSNVRFFSPSIPSLELFFLFYRIERNVQKNVPFESIINRDQF
jgi:hypothetical protein